MSSPAGPLTLSAILSLALAGPAAADDAPAAELAATAPAAPLPVTIAGLVDVYLSLNPSRGASNDGPSDLRAFDVAANQPALSYAELSLERTGAAGFRLDVGVGPTARIVNATDAASAGGDLLENIQQAYVTWSPTSTLTVKAGKMVTHHGLEVIESASNWCYSHGLLFSWALPVTQTGVAVSWAASPAVDVTAFVVNGLNNTVESNTFKSPGAQVVVRATDRVTVIGNYSAFNEQPGGAGTLGDFGDAFHLVDLVATAAVRDGLDLALEADLGIDRAIADDQAFVGVAGFARLGLGRRLDSALRAEYLHDGASPLLGVLLAEPTDLVAATATISHRPSDQLVLRGELRVDRALDGATPFTSRDGDARSSQLTASASAVALF